MGRWACSSRWAHLGHRPLPGPWVHSGLQARPGHRVRWVVVRPGRRARLGLRARSGHWVRSGHWACLGRGARSSRWACLDHNVSPKTEIIDYDNVLKIAYQVKPKLIIAGASSYSRK
ncbi:MAG: hypothetical protein Q8778_02525, partial [Sweet potato little leaf phytoplasma]|nr:hypothetical protein [Sweet potato little leaf phytoplasma]